jgi:hypothetical protein
LKSNRWSLVISIVFLLVSFSCASTKMVKNWVYPETGTLQFEKVMALVLVQDKFVRQAGEDEMVRQIKQVEAIAAYRVLPDRELGDESLVRKAVAESGVDGIIVMRPVYDRQEVSYVSGGYPSSYHSFYGYYGWAYPVAYSPGYYRSDQLVGVETNIYDVKTEKLVWSGVSQTVNPKDVKKVVAETARAVRRVMKKYGFLDG